MLAPFAPGNARGRGRGAIPAPGHVPGNVTGNVAVFRRLLLEARPYWPHILLLSFVNLLATPIALLTPVPLKIAVDSIASTSPLPSLYRLVLPASGQSSIGAIVFVTATLMVLIAAVDELQSFGAWLLETSTGERLVLDFRAKLFRHMPRSRIHAACAQAHRDAFGEQFGNGFSIARVNLPIRA